MIKVNKKTINKINADLFKVHILKEIVRAKEVGMDPTTLLAGLYDIVMDAIMLHDEDFQRNALLIITETIENNIKGLRDGKNENIYTTK